MTVATAFVDKDTTDIPVSTDVELFVGDLSHFCVESQLTELFARFGQVQDCRIRRSENRGHSLMYGFVKMQNLEQATKAAQILNDFMFMGRQIRLVSSFFSVTLSFSFSFSFVIGLSLCLSLCLSLSACLSLYHTFTHLLTVSVTTAECKSAQRTEPHCLKRLVPARTCT
jgi:RNA recognition motif-containing protein